jgi:hypothetical protein
MAHGEKARGVVESGFSGSPSFVAVVQPTDLRDRHERFSRRKWGPSMKPHYDEP